MKKLYQLSRENDFIFYLKLGATNAQSSAPVIKEIPRFGHLYCI